MGTESYACLDRIEGNEAVVIVDDRQREIPVLWLPKGVKEGDTLRIFIEVEESTTQSRKEKLQFKREALRKNSSLSGNFDL
jgi:hypothetical protein